MTKPDPTFTPQSLPNHFLMLLKAGLKGNNYTQGIAHNGMLIPPALCMEPLYLELEPLSAKKVHHYHRLVNWTDSEILHPCLLHILAFPLHILLMTRADFPFKLLGLIHVSNEIRQFCPVKRDDRLHFSCFLTDIQRHAKGWIFTLQSEVRVKNQLCWQGKSVNLFQDTAGQRSRDARHPCLVKSACAAPVTWQLGSDLGRRYASLSGDFNPIHLSVFSARIFGLKRHIAHGMFSKARCISTLHQLYPDYFKGPFSVQTKFIKPIFLPAKVNFIHSDKVVHGQPREIAFSLRGFETLQPHLKGALALI
jgi:acyl dehydratase